MKNLTVLDYGVGNLFNLMRALEHVGARAELVTEAEPIVRADRLLIPGVGAFGAGIKNINQRGLAEPIRNFVKSGKPLLGICLGMQLLLSKSEELGDWDGLNLIPGVVRKLATTAKLPHITWNHLDRRSSWDRTVLDSLSQPLMYFNHSFYVDAQDPQIVAAVCEYAGFEFAAVIQSENISACQFHPERSAQVGLQLLSNFLAL